jgi:hypothetical protein
MSWKEFFKLNPKKTILWIIIFSIFEFYFYKISWTHPMIDCVMAPCNQPSAIFNSSLFYTTTIISLILSYFITIIILAIVNKLKK